MMMTRRAVLGGAAGAVAGAWGLKLWGEAASGAATSPATGPDCRREYVWLFGKNVKVEVVGALLVVKSDGIPDHTTEFPNPHANPNRILRSRIIRSRFRWAPVKADKVMALPMGPTGVAINGVLFFTTRTTRKERMRRKMRCLMSAAGIPIRWGGITIIFIPNAFIRRLWIRRGSIRR